VAALFMACRQGLWVVRIRRLSRRGGEVPRWLDREVSAVAATLGMRPPRLVVAEGIPTPLVWCWGTPRLLWPAALVQPAEPAHWRGVIAHELAHLKRRDHWVAWVELAATWLWWWNPIFWYVRSQVRESAEQACDAWVVAVLPGSRRQYAEALVEVSELVSKTALPQPALGASSGAGRTFERRLTMILRERTACKLSWQGLIGVAILAIVAVPSWLMAQATQKGGASDKPSGAAAAEQPKIGPWELSGEVETIDTAKGTITLGGKQIAGTTLSVAKAVRVILDDGTGDRFGFAEGKLTDVAEGMPVTVRLSSDQKEVIGIWAEGPSVKGTLKAVDTANNSVTVSVALSKGEPEQEKTFDVAKTAKLAILENIGKDFKGKDKGLVQPDKLADLPIGAAVTVKLAADKKTVGRIQAEAQSILGTFKSVDAAKNTLTLQVTPVKGQPGAEQTYALAKDIKVTLDGASGKLSDLPADAPVIVRLSVNQKAIASIQAEGSSAQGVITAVDAVKGTLTLRIAKKGEPATEHTYEVSKDAKVSLDGVGGKLSDLPVGAAVIVKLSITQKAVWSVQAEGQSIKGAAKVVDADSRGITIADKEGEKTYTVAKDATIAVDGKPAQLADVPADAVVAAKLSADGQTVRSLSADGSNVQGVVRSVDGVNNEIVIELPKQGEAKYKFADNVRVVTGPGEKLRKLEDVKPDLKVTLLLRADQKVVHRIVIVED
jgi:hypothetical protein